MRLGPALSLLAFTLCARGAQETSDFPAFVWRLEHAAGPIAPELVEAFGGVNVEGAAEDDWARELGLDFYVGHAPGRDELHIDDHAPWYRELWDRYWTERDPSVLVRQPCLSRASTLAQLERQLARSLRARDGDCGRGASLGDEVGLTRYGGPLDLCASAECRAAFAAFLAESQRWSSLWPDEGTPPPYPGTDETRLAWIDGDPRHVAAWMARREFHHTTFVGVVEELTARTRELAPGVPLGLVGLAGRTAFGGVAVEDVLPHLDFLEAYPTLDTRELLYTLRGPEQQSWCTVFREAAAPAAPAWRLSEHWLRGGEAAVLWSDRELEGDALYRAVTRHAVEQVRELRSALPSWRPATRGLAIVNDSRSLALSWLRDSLHDGPTWPKRFASYQVEHGTREVALQALLRLAEDCGLLPGALPIERVGAATRERFPVLVLCQQVTLDPADLARLEAFVEAGGSLLVWGELDRWDLRGEPSALDAWERLKALGGERVARLELDGARYLARRLSVGEGYAPEHRQHLDRALRRAGVERPTWRVVVDEDPTPWLLAQQQGALEGELLCAALPNLQSADERARHLRRLTVRVEGLEGLEVEWLSPRAPLPGGEISLGPGEVLVFRTRRRGL